jgi:K+ transporter
MITPAISVLSAVEGLKVATTTLNRYVVPITVGILVLLATMATVIAFQAIISGVFSHACALS